MIGYYNSLKNSENLNILDSLQLSMPVNEDGETSWFSMVKKAETLDTQIDHLADSKVLLSKKLNEFLERGMVKHELRVTSCQLRVTSYELKA